MRVFDQRSWFLGGRRTLHLFGYRLKVPWRLIERALDVNLFTAGDWWISYLFNGITHPVEVLRNVLLWITFPRFQRQHVWVSFGWSKGSEGYWLRWNFFHWRDADELEECFPMPSDLGLLIHLFAGAENRAGRKDKGSMIIYSRNSPEIDIPFSRDTTNSCMSAISASKKQIHHLCKIINQFLPIHSCQAWWKPRRAKKFTR